MEVAGKVVVVTGGGSGIGAALSRRFAADGAAAVIVADLNEHAAREVAAGIGGDALRADVTVESEVQGLVRHALKLHGGVDLYCSNAGVGLGQGPETPDAQWQKSWEVHVMGHVYAVRALLPGWLERGEGYFLGTVSAAGLLNQVLSAPYGVTKAAGLSFMEWIAINYRDRGVRVSALCPQGVKTPMLKMSGSTFLDDGALEPEQVAEVVAKALPDEPFLILPHPEVAEYFRRKGDDYERWIRGMRRLRGRMP